MMMMMVVVVIIYRIWQARAPQAAVRLGHAAPRQHSRGRPSAPAAAAPAAAVPVSKKLIQLGLNPIECP